jgi:hypothetical protein
LGIRVGRVPGAYVVARGLVGADEALAMIEAKGTAVGFVDKNVNVREGVGVGEVMFVTGAPDEAPEELDKVAAGVVGLGEAWRGS